MDDAPRGASLGPDAEARSEATAAGAVGGRSLLRPDGTVVALPDDAGRWVTLPGGDRIFVLNRGAVDGADVRPADGGGGVDGETIETPRAARAYEVRSDEIEEVIGYVPGRLVRWGVMLAAVVVAGMVALSFAVHYPQVVRGRALVTTPRAPVRLASPTGAPVHRLLVREGQPVRRGDPLAVLESTTDDGDAEAVQALLGQMEPALRAGRVPAAAVPPLPQLGDAQPAYSAFAQALAEYGAFAAGGEAQRKEATLRRELQGYQTLRGTLATRLGLLERDRDVAGRERERNRQLAARQMLSDADRDRAEADYLARAQAVESGRGEVTDNEVRMAQTERALLELGEKQAADELRLRLAVGTAFDALRQALRRWEAGYVLRAPVDGRVSFFRPLQEGQFVAAAEPVLAVVPPGSAATASVVLSQADAGRVRAGQRVVLRLDAFPADQFGAVEGRVERVSLVTDRLEPDGEKQPAYLVTVGLPHGLRTTAGRRLDFRQEMQGNADVVTDDLRVVDRIFHALRPAA